MCLVLEAPHLGRQSKQVLYKKSKYICWLTEKHISICSSVNREIYGTRRRDAGQGQLPSIFFGEHHR
jgi:hypothetical protein